MPTPLCANAGDRLRRPVKRLPYSTLDLRICPAAIANRLVGHIVLGGNAFVCLMPLVTA